MAWPVRAGDLSSGCFLFASIRGGGPLEELVFLKSSAAQHQTPAASPPGAPYLEPRRDAPGTRLRSSWGPGSPISVLLADFRILFPFQNKGMLINFLYLATALENFEKVFQPEHAKVHNGIAPRQQ
jgi:hypothetical protein